MKYNQILTKTKMQCKWKSKRHMRLKVADGKSKPFFRELSGGIVYYFPPSGLFAFSHNLVCFGLNWSHEFRSFSRFSILLPSLMDFARDICRKKACPLLYNPLFLNSFSQNSLFVTVLYHVLTCT